MSTRRNESAGRKYTTAACVSCKKRKVRCDNKQPKCSNCTLYDVDCTYGEDRRRTASTVKTISSLIERVQGLEEQLKKTQSDEIDQQHHAQLNVHNAMLPVSAERGDAVAPATNHYDTAGFPMVGHEVDLGESVDTLFDWDEAARMSPTNPIQPAFGWPMPLSEDYWRQAMGHQLNVVLDNERVSPASASVVDSDPSSTEPDHLLPSRQDLHRLPARSGVPDNQADELDFSDDELANSFATTSGCHKVSDDGRRRYYGPTSNLRMVNDGLLSLYQPSTDAGRGGAEKNIHQAGLSWEEDEQFEDHLARLYFTWHNPLIREVDEAMYRQARQSWRSGQDTPFYSPALETAILANGALYSDRTHPAIAGQVAEFFNARAKIYVDIEMDSPSLATAQAVLILAAYESSKCRDSRAWLYVGISVQIVTDLGLHVGMQREAHSTDAETDIESVERVQNQIFWAVFTADCFHGSYSGRPSLMSNMRFRVLPPQRPPSTIWTPYTDSEDICRVSSLPETSSLCDIPVKVAQLATKLNRILENIYTLLPRPSDEIQAFVLAMSNDLSEWMSTLPPRLQIDLDKFDASRPPLPFTFLLYLNYYEAMVFLHRPFLADAGPFTNSPRNLSAGQICSDAAVQICMLLEAYHAQYQLRYVNCSAVRIAILAGTIHAYNSCVYSSSRGQEAKIFFLKAVRILGELSKTFDSATRGLEIITALRSDWQAQRFIRTKGKRRRSSQATSLGPGGRTDGSGRQSNSSARSHLDVRSREQHI